MIDPGPRKPIRIDIVSDPSIPDGTILLFGDPFWRDHVLFQSNGTANMARVLDLEAMARAKRIAIITGIGK